MAKVTVTTDSIHHISKIETVEIDGVDNFVHSNHRANAQGNDGIELRSGRQTKAWFNIQNVIAFKVEGDLINDLLDKER